MSDSNQPRKSGAHRIPPYRRPIIVVSFLIVLLIAIAVTVVIFFSIDKNRDLDSSNTDDTTSLPQVDPAAKPDPEDQSPVPEDKVTQYEGEDPNDLEELTGRVAYKGVSTEQNFRTLTVSASIDQYLMADGTCTLRLKDSSGAEVYSATMPASADVTTSACGPFEIPVTNFSPGDYRIEIAVSGDGKTGLITDTEHL